MSNLEEKFTLLMKQWEKTVLAQMQANHDEVTVQLGVLNTRMVRIEELSAKAGTAKRTTTKKAPAEGEAAAAGEPAAAAVAETAAPADVVAQALAPVVAVPTTPYTWFTQEWKIVENQAWRDAHSTPELLAMLENLDTIKKKKPEDIKGRLVSGAKPAFDWYKNHTDKTLYTKLVAEHTALLAAAKKA